MVLVLDIIHIRFMWRHLCHSWAAGPGHVVEYGCDVILEFFSRLGDKWPHIHVSRLSYIFPRVSLYSYVTVCVWGGGCYNREGVIAPCIAIWRWELLINDTVSTEISIWCRSDFEIRSEPNGRGAVVLNRSVLGTKWDWGPLVSGGARMFG